MENKICRRVRACALFYALIFGIMLGFAGSAAAQVRTVGRAPDPTGNGEFAVKTSEYRLPASVDPTVMTDRKTEVWARVWRPVIDEEDRGSEETRRLPLVVFLHGNHGTCGGFSFCPNPDQNGVCKVEDIVALPNGPRIDNRRDYTFTGTCPLKGSGTPAAQWDYFVTPNHEGYAYLAEQLASRGYLVVSINANRGITAGPRQDIGTPGNPLIEDSGLNLARGRLILKHLELLSRWNRGLEPTPASLGFSLRGAINFRKVALVGHSRGGEGARAAYNLYTGRNSDVTLYDGINWKSRIQDAVDFKGIFEIAPVDRQTIRTLNAEGTTWSVMLPGCDGDVVNQQGLWVYDRMMRSFTEQPARQKAFYYVLGANHNYWNTEWQASDSSGCYDPKVQLFETDPDTGVLPGVIGSEKQRATGSASILALVRGAMPIGESDEEDSFSFLTNFDPQFQLPAVVTNVARIQRGFISSPSSRVTLALEDFEQPAGSSQFGVPNDASNVMVEHVGVVEHGAPFSSRNSHFVPIPLPSFLHAGRLAWQRKGADVFFQINFTTPGSGLDLSDYATLDFRVDRESPTRTTLNSTDATDFHIQLVAYDGTLSSPVAASNFIEVKGPFGTPDADLRIFGLPVDGYHINMPTARIPLGAFGVEDLSRTRGVRLTFDATATGKIYVTNFRASRRGFSFFGERDSMTDLATAADAVAAPDTSTLSGLSNAQALEFSSGRVIYDGNVVENVEFVASTATPTGSFAAVASSNASGTVRLTVTTKTSIPVSNELLTMSIGTAKCDGSYVDGSTQRMIFECLAQDLSAADGAAITVRGNARTTWNFGTFNSRR